MRSLLFVVAVQLCVAGCKDKESTPTAARTAVPTASGVAALFAEAKPTPQGDAVPWSLTASDGSGLVMTRIEGKAVVEGPLAFTELHLYFHNPEARQREGTFEITLPAGAAVSRFAMEIGGQLMEAEVVEKQAARRAYEDFLHRRQDPALLEKAAGNQFSARVFPIAPNADKHLVISFSQEVSPGRYALRLRGLPMVKQLDMNLKIRATSGKVTEEILSKRDWKPDRDFDVAVAPAEVPQSIASGELVAARVKVVVPDASQPPRGVTLLVDTSASRAAGYANEVRRIRELVDELRAHYGAALELQVVAFDQTTEELYSGPISGATAIDSALLKRGALGASDLSQALRWIGEHTPKQRVVIATDGVVTAGDELEELRKTVTSLGQRGVERLDVVLSGGIRDTNTARALAQASLSRPGVVLDLDRGAADVATRIGLGVSAAIPVTAPTASWVFPSTIAAAQSDDEVTIYLRRPASAKSVAVTVGTVTTELSPVAVPPILISRAVASSEISELDAKLASQTGADAARTRALIVKRSLAARVVSSQTSLLVLETENDYARFGIDRTALADILAIDGTGIVLLHRQGPTLIAESPAKVEKNDEPAHDPGPDNDPPPPEEEAKPDDGEEESGGTGTAMALDEGRMGKKDSDRAEGQYRMRDMRTEEEREQQKTPALSGPLLEVQQKMTSGKLDAALTQAVQWRLKEPGDVLALIALGAVLERQKDLVMAARVYGSIIDLYPARADFRRFAGERLERIGASVRGLIVDTYRRAVAERPDHLSGHRLLAYALLQDGKHAEALAAILVGLDRTYPRGRFEGGTRILLEDAGMIGAAYAAKEPAKRDEITKELSKRGSEIATDPSTRFIMYWETDSNDVDFHIRDAQDGHAWYSDRSLESGGELYADITDGYGPECFAIKGKATAAPYRLSINYYSQGPMGYGMGLLHIQTHDGKGNLTFEARPYVIMTSGAFVDLGSWGK